MPVVEINGVDTYYEDYGEGRPIVVLHGATADHQVWAEQLQQLTDEYRVILYDLRGHGKTGGSDRDQYTIDLYADDLATFITELELDAPIVLGHSMGGMIGYVFANEYPDQLSALITVGSATPNLFSLQERLVRVELMRVMSLIADNERLRSAFFWLQLKVFGEDSAGDVDELQRVRDAHVCDNLDIAGAEQSKIYDAVRQYHTAPRELHLAETPMLVMYGENELFIESHAAYLHRQFDSCTTVEIPEAGHNAQVDNPEFIRTQIRDFISTHELGRPQYN